MNESKRIRLNLLGDVMDVRADELDREVSPFTGIAGRRFQATVTARGDEAHERLDAELSPEPGGEVVLSSPDGTDWLVSDHSISYQPGAGPYTLYVHSFKLREQEEIQIDIVEFGALALALDQWQLKELENPVTFTFLANLDANQHQHFEQLHRQVGNSYFPVTWGGVTHQPLSMRFGQCLWEAADDGGARHMVTLVAQEGDTSEQAGVSMLFEPWRSRLTEQAVRIRSGFDALINELERARVLSDEAINRIKEGISSPEESHLREFDRVNNVEDHFP